MNQDTWRQIGPVLLSVLTIPLSLWIIYTGAKGDRATVSQFASALPLGIVGTVAFTAAVRLAVRADHRDRLPGLGRYDRPRSGAAPMAGGVNA